MAIFISQNPNNQKLTQTHFTSILYFTTFNPSPRQTILYLTTIQYQYYCNQNQLTKNIIIKILFQIANIQNFSPKVKSFQYFLFIIIPIHQTHNYFEHTTKLHKLNFPHNLSKTQSKHDAPKAQRKNLAPIGKQAVSQLYHLDYKIHTIVLCVLYSDTKAHSSQEILSSNPHSTASKNHLPTKHSFVFQQYLSPDPNTTEATLYSLL